MGVSRYLREHKPGVRIVAAEPLPGELVQGLRSLDEGFIPEIFDPTLIDAKYLVSNREAIAALRELVFREGIFAGPSCGAVLVAAAREAAEMESGTIVALLPDGGWKYLSAGTFSTDLDEMEEALEGGVNWWWRVGGTEAADSTTRAGSSPTATTRSPSATSPGATRDPSPTRLAWLARALELIPAGSDVLDLGCGAGVPMTRALAAGRRVTGVDLSARQIELARADVPDATFLQADMTALDLPAASLDAVVAFYSLTHVPRADLPALLDAIHRWLRPGGVLVATMGAQEHPTRSRTTGSVCRCSSATTGRSRIARSFGAAGFEIEMAVVEAEPEDRHDALFLWVVARKPAGSRRRVPEPTARHPGPAAVACRPRSARRSSPRLAPSTRTRRAA